MSQKATHRLIDSVWTLEYNLVGEDKIEIIKYSREDKDGYDNERSLPQITLVETPDRTVISVFLRNKFDSFTRPNKNTCDVELIVTNPKHIFDY